MLVRLRCFFLRSPLTSSRLFEGLTGPQLLRAPAFCPLHGRLAFPGYRAGRLHFLAQFLPPPYRASWVLSFCLLMQTTPAWAFSDFAFFWSLHYFFSRSFSLFWPLPKIRTVLSSFFRPSGLMAQPAACWAEAIVRWVPAPPPRPPFPSLFFERSGFLVLSFLFFTSSRWPLIIDHRRRDCTASF